MAIIYRHQKGDPLTIEEMDGNFLDLDQRLKALETSPAMGEGIKTLTQDRDQVTVMGTFGSVLGRLKLPKIFPTLCGRWQGDRDYYVYDWVQVGLALYSCKAPHKSMDFDKERDLWILVFAMEPAHEI